MNNILLSGLINIETTLQVDRFPLTYEPVRYPFFGVNSTVSGVGYNIVKALSVLGNQVDFLSLIGQDFAGRFVRDTLARDNIPQDHVLSVMPHTAQSVVIYDQAGKRQIHTDLKDIQERNYPREQFKEALSSCQLTILCNINFSRPFLQLARQAGKLVATDIHAIADLEDEYNRDFMVAAHILFMSDERLPEPPERWAQRLQNRYGTPIIVIGLGAEGALLAVKDDAFMERIPAVPTRSIINTIGAGDALFSSFNHVYNQTPDPYRAIQHAIVFASYKIGAVGAAEGFLDGQSLETLFREKFRENSRKLDFSAKSSV